MSYDRLKEALLKWVDLKLPNDRDTVNAYQVLLNIVFDLMVIYNKKWAKAQIMGYPIPEVKIKEAKVEEMKTNAKHRRKVRNSYFAKLINNEDVNQNDANAGQSSRDPPVRFLNTFGITL